MVNDILTDDDFDLLVRDGDLVVGDATIQHQTHILMANKGDYKESPLLGVGIRSYTNDDDWYGNITQEVNRQFEGDGMEVDEITFSGAGKISINAEYSNS